MNLTIVIDLDHDAFQPFPAQGVTEVLMDMIQSGKLDQSLLNPGQIIAVREVNGNSCGYIETED